MKKKQRQQQRKWFKTQCGINWLATCVCRYVQVFGLVFLCIWGWRAMQTMLCKRYIPCERKHIFSLYSSAGNVFSPCCRYRVECSTTWSSSWSVIGQSRLLCVCTACILHMDCHCMLNIHAWKGNENMEFILVRASATKLMEPAFLRFFSISRVQCSYLCLESYSSTTNLLFFVRFPSRIHIRGPMIEWMLSLMKLGTRLLTRDKIHIQWNFFRNVNEIYSVFTEEIGCILVLYLFCILCGFRYIRLTHKMELLFIENVTVFSPCCYHDLARSDFGSPCNEMTLIAYRTDIVCGGSASALRRCS